MKIKRCWPRPNPSWAKRNLRAFSHAPDSSTHSTALPMNFTHLLVRGKRPSHRLTRIDTDSEEEAFKFNFGGSKVDQQTQ
jgi:hypothetical protein